MRLLIILLGTAALAGCGIGHSGSRDNGPTTSRSYQVGSFDKIEVAGPYQVSVATGGGSAVQATGGAHRLDDMVVEVDGGTLKIHPKRSHGFFHFGWSHGSDVRVEVHAPALNEATIAGSGDINVDTVRGDRFEGTVAGSGSLQLTRVETRDLKFSIAGSGGIKAAGQATQAKYDIAGSGDIQASGVQSQDASVEIAGSGSVAAHATGTAKVEVLGSGDVTITGGARCTIEKHGSGDVHCS